MAGTVDNQGFGDYFFYPESRVQRGEWILEDDLHVAAQVAHFFAVGGEQVLALVTDAAGRGLDQAKDEASEGALPGTGFAYQAEGFTGLDVEGYVVYGTDFFCGSSLRVAAERRVREGKDLG